MIRKGEKVNLFIPCLMDMFSPNVALSVISVLERIGNICVINKESTCCGRCLYLDGAEEEAKFLSNKLTSEYDSNLNTVIPSSACAGYIRQNYKVLLKNVEFPAVLKDFASHTYELCDYIVNVKKITSLNNTFKHRVFYFKSCSARNIYGLENEAETLLKNTIGLDLLHDPNLNLCCSANGRLALNNPSLSNEMLGELLNKIYLQGAQYVTSTDIHCLQYMDAFIKSEGIGIEVIHIADILANEN